eukprot:5227028-Heterocapsa_arctica.AAC.1
MSPGRRPRWTRVPAAAGIPRIAAADRRRRRSRSLRAQKELPPSCSPPGPPTTASRPRATAPQA